eukprot:gb/GECG01016433.1/.p1 GENE.gb/GECG01016433.1/~~gb/GECG01016433.1/.p1  ORF type:complete len:206 (+),score=13.38 gb/GECG01016433.1/:1-618(+)
MSSTWNQTTLTAGSTVAAVAAAAGGLYYWYTRCRGGAGRRSAVDSAFKQPTRSCFAVYCGSSKVQGKNADAINEATRRLGKALVGHGLGLVYGGGNAGLMGTISRSVDAAGGDVYGVIPGALHGHELTGTGVQPDKLQIVSTMHQRKERMARMSSAFIALPGGYVAVYSIRTVVCRFKVYSYYTQIWYARGAFGSHFMVPTFCAR